MTEKGKPGTISLELFMKMLQTMDIKKLRSIDIEKLPDGVPEHFSDLLDSDKKHFLDDLHMTKQMGRIGEYNKNIESLGQETADIIEKIRSNRLVNETRFFVEKVKKLQLISDENNLKKCTQIPSIRLLKESDAIHNILSDIRNEYVNALKYVPIIKKHYSKSPEIKQRLKGYIFELKRQLLPIHKIIIDFYKLRLTINLCEMRHLKLKIQNTALNIESIDTQIDDLNKELVKHKTLWAKISNKSGDTLSLQKKINELHQMRQQLEVPIDEIRLTQWLDSLIDIFIGPGTDDIANSKFAQYAQKMIFSLLVEYCEQQETAAKDVAENPFIVVNAEKAINFLLSSENFILHYFNTKKKEMSSWLDNAVTDKKSSLEDIKKNLLLEMKRNIKFIR